ncbi:MAG: hypothetical protein J7M38_05195 [Armatimonadetes bacterium]|nr:hypothetical protein [Armatimonadota bacterium]
MVEVDAEEAPERRLWPINYQQELLSALSQCRRLRVDGRPNYPDAVYTLYMELTSDLQRTVREHLLESGIDVGEHLERIRNTRIKNPYLRKRAENAHERALLWELADSLFEAIRYALEVHDYLGRAMPIDRRERGKG